MENTRVKDTDVSLGFDPQGVPFSRYSNMDPGAMRLPSGDGSFRSNRSDKSIKLKFRQNKAELEMKRVQLEAAHRRRREEIELEEQEKLLDIQVQALEDQMALEIEFNDQDSRAGDFEFENRPTSVPTNVMTADGLDPMWGNQEGLIDELNVRTAPSLEMVGSMVQQPDTVTVNFVNTSSDGGPNVKTALSQEMVGSMVQPDHVTVNFVNTNSDGGPNVNTAPSLEMSGSMVQQPDTVNFVNINSDGGPSVHDRKLGPVVLGAVDNIGEPNATAVDGLHAVVNHLRLLQTRLELPRPELKGFSGDPLDYPRFKSSFQANIETRTQDDGEKYQNLRKYCFGKANDVIKRYDMLPPGKAFAEATNELYRQFGQPHLITQEFHRKLKQVADIKPGERHELRSYSELLETAHLSISSVGKETALDHPSYLVDAVSKLPLHDRRGWLKKASDLREKKGEVCFKDVVDFVKKISLQVNDSEFSILLDNKRSHTHNSTGGANVKKTSHDQSASKSTYFVSNGNKNNGNGNGASNGNGNGASLKCSVSGCSSEHKIWQCDILKSKPWKQRMEAIKGQRLCFNCLNLDDKVPHSLVSQCPLPKECKVKGCKASRKHHTILHFDEQTKKVDVDNACTATNDHNVYFPAFPVIVKSPVTGKEVRTWAGIDSYSSACFCEKSLLDELSLESAEQKISLNTLHGSQDGYSTVIELVVESLAEGDQEPITLNEVYSWDQLPMGEKHIPDKAAWMKYDHLRDLQISTAPTERIKVLVGSNVPEAHQQLEWRPGPNRGDPVAVRYKWGWTLLGGIPHGKLDCNFVSVDKRYEDLNQKLIQMAEFEYAGTRHNFKKPISAEDLKARDVLEQGTYLCDGHYYVPIPLKDSYSTMPNNRELAYKRLQSVKKKLKAGKLVAENKTEYQAYCDIFDDYRRKGYVRRIPEEECETDDVINYVPFHHVLHPAKPGRLRIVWDAAARYEGSCLNDHIYSGEDNINSLLGVLLRFRTGGEVAIQADINCMFNQVFISDNLNLCRYLWFEDNDLDGEVAEFQLLHNFFGGTHAPGNAGYALQRTCTDNVDKYHPEVIKTGLRHSYVDDVIRSIDRETARIIVEQIFKLMEEGGFVLAKFVTNDPELLQLVDPERRAPSMQDFEFEQATDQDHHERVLGVGWNVTEDSLVFKTRNKERPLTRRGLLGYIASLFDPEGAIAPVTLQPKQILQKLTRQGAGWDDPLPEEDAAVVRNWLESLAQLSTLKRPRYTVPKGFGKIICQELHAFSDGSETGYGYVLFARYITEDGQVHVSFLVGKALVTPKKTKTIPRIELQAALLSMRAVKFVVEEADVTWDVIYQWIDSTAVLAMLNNVSKRFLPYCANRLQEIRELQQEINIQMKHVPGLQNIADVCSRGLTVSKFLECQEYYNGPKFLWEPVDSWPVCPAIEKLPSDHPELKREATVMAIVKCEDPLMKFVERYSSWAKLKVATAWLLRFKRWLKERKDYAGPTGPIKITEIRRAEVAVVTYVQRQVFRDELPRLGKIGVKMARCQFHNLKPFVDAAGSLRVGGRLTESELTYSEKHQLILPKEHHLTRIIVRSYHETNQHAPPKTLLYLLRKRFWVLNGSTVVHWAERQCITCMRALALPRDQIQGALPKGRVAIGNLWYQTGCDIMGPVLVKIHRSQEKRYVLGLVSFTVKAAHFEILPDLTVQSFLNAMRRFVARRSRPKKLITDNAGTFSAGLRELNALQDLYNSSGVENYMREEEIEWVPNVPKASNRNGLFERPFRTLRRVLLNVIKGQVTTEDQLATVVAECEHLYNSRPLCANSSSARDPAPITPNQILNPEPAHAHPPGVFYERDLIVRNRYRQVQALINAFWARFRVEYLTSLQERTKSITPIRDFAVNDLVMLCDEMKIAHRGHYPLGVIVAVEPSDADDIVRKVSVKTATGTFQRPTNKICLLEAAEERETHIR